MKIFNFMLYAFVALCGVLTAGAQTRNAILPLFPPVVSTIASNGDLNPYGIAMVPRTLLGTTVLQAGDILVSNFNNSANLSGTGSTIVRFNQQGQQSLFYQGQPGLGLTGALGILSDGIVVVGSLPTTDGTPATVQPGSLLFIDPNGNLLATIGQAGLVNGPWGMALHDFGGGAAQIFVSNVLSGQITRFEVTYNGGGQTIAVQPAVTVAAGYSHRTDPTAIVLGPSGLAYDEQHDILYVANSADNTIYAVNGAATSPGQGTGSMIFNDATKLHGPVNLTLAPNGHLIAANSDGSNQDPNQPSELVEFTPGGQFIGEYSIDQGSGAAFGISVTMVGPGVVRVAAVDDSTNTLKTFTTMIQ